MAESRAGRILRIAQLVSHRYLQASPSRRKQLGRLQDRLIAEFMALMVQSGRRCGKTYALQLLADAVGSGRLEASGQGRTTAAAASRTAAQPESTLPHPQRPQAESTPPAAQAARHVPTPSQTPRRVPSSAAHGLKRCGVVAFFSRRFSWLR